VTYFGKTKEMKRKQVTADDLYNLWLEPYHGITVQWLVDNEPELIKTPEWYKKYAVTQAQYEEWYERALVEICKSYRISKKQAIRRTMFDFLNIAPSVK
jgi:hypothetical protein